MGCHYKVCSQLGGQRGNMPLSVQTGWRTFTVIFQHFVEAHHGLKSQTISAGKEESKSHHCTSALFILFSREELKKQLKETNFQPRTHLNAVAVMSRANL